MSAFPIKVEGAEAVRARLLLAPNNVREAVRRAVEQSAAAVTAGAKSKVSDDVLRVRTGKLRRSLHYVMGGGIDTPSAVIGTNVEYAGIHEFGGKTKAHVIEAVNAKVLAFKTASGATAFATRVQHPGSRMPERSYLRSTLGEQESAIKMRIDAAVGKAIP